MDRRERKRQKRHHHLSVEGVAAMLNDEDADLYNITDAAVQEDALAAAWNLTALAAEAIRQLAEATSQDQRGHTGHRRPPHPPGPPKGLEVLSPREFYDQLST